jgi:Xaa-Pro aminopeptidase
MIPVEEHQRRRKQLLTQLKNSVGLVFAGEQTNGDGRFKPDANFVYLTGIDDEPGAVLMLDPANDNPMRREVLFLRPLNPEMERWDGYRETISASLKRRTGFGAIQRLNALPGAVTTALRKCKSASCLHPFAVYPSAVSADLNVFQQVSQRVPGVRIEDRTSLLTAMRAVKSPRELALIERAADITEQAFLQVMKQIRPGLTEAQVQLALETVYRQQGGEIAYGTIVGGGLNGTVLHYIRNREALHEGDLVVIDSAASFGGYAAALTRTFPVSGWFSAEQREIYEVVLASQLSAIKAARPGATFHEVDAAARRVIDKAGLGDAYIHSIGHPLGLSVHDVQPDHPLKAGMVITIEPGVYLPERRLGVRIEDDLLITRKGNRNLTPNVPKTVREIEQAMAG